jgi:GNAT superfamily N-acetyltransferase
VDEITTRRAGPEDARSIGDVYLTSLRATYDFPVAQSDDEVRRWIADVLVPTTECWVAAAPDGVPVAVLSLTDDMIDQLYVAPAFIGRGIGSRLMAVAKARRPEGLDLYTFQVNARARRFYAYHGFVEVELGDGSGNDEGQPDVRCAWRPAPA